MTAPTDRVGVLRESRDHVAAFDDCPDWLRDLIRECESCIYQLVDEAKPWMARSIEAVEKGYASEFIDTRWLDAVKRYQNRIDALHSAYYDQKFGYAEARDKYRGRVS